MLTLNLNVQLPGKAESRHLPGNDRLKTKNFGEFTSPKDRDLNIHLGLGIHWQEVCTFKLQPKSETQWLQTSMRPKILRASICAILVQSL
jgi:hypothetical protein